MKIKYSDGTDARVNGELSFFNFIKDKVNVVFDVGSHYESIYVDCGKEVHYFEPNKAHYDRLSQLVDTKTSRINNFGLSDKTEESYYYPTYESFYNRVVSCYNDDSRNRVLLKLKTAKEYMDENGVDKNIDFLKIDTEGYELKVLKGFGDYLNRVKIVQFEYGGTFLDNGVKLVDVINYLKMYNFSNFSYIMADGVEQITDFQDHYNYCNVVCINSSL